MTTTNGTTTTTAPTSTALVRHEEPRAIEPATITELRALAQDAADSRFFGAESQAQCMMIMLAGRDLGFSFTQALRAFHVIKGKPALSADGMVAVCLSRPDLCEYFRPVEVTDTSARWITKRAGQEPVESVFTIDDAQRADLFSQNGAMFKKYPKRMLSARAKAFLARDVYPELLMGLYDPDELRGSASEPRRVEAETQPAPPSAPAVEESQDETIAVADEFGRKVAEASLQSDLDTIVKLLVKANREHAITAAQFDALAARVKARRAEVGK